MKRPGNAPSTLKLDDPEGFRRELVAALRAPLRPALVVIAGDDLGMRCRIGEGSSSIVIGRDPEAGMSLKDPGVSWHHARVEDRGDGWALVDDGSTNGTLHNNKRCQEAVLAPNDKIQVGSTVIRFEVQDATDQAYDEMVQRLINIDDLTGLYLRRRFDQELEQMIQAAVVAGGRIGMLVMDLDGVKAINDSHGHLFGAYVISDAGKVIGRLVGDRGIAARFGGDEYVAAVRGLDLQATAAVGEEIRQAIATHHFEKDGIPLRPGISIGIAAFPESAGSAIELFRRADEALYRAKSAGKNCVRA